MKKLILLLSTAVLVALPASASANHGHSSTKVLAAKNSAFICKALLRQDRAAFMKTFGTNGNTRNAYGKCVSLHARATHRHPAMHARFHGLTLTSNGTVTSADANSLAFSGPLTGVLGGTSSSAWTIDWTKATSNGSGGLCAPATGSTTLTLPALGTLTKSEQGTVCEVGASGSNVEHSLSGGSFTVSAGTGLLAKVSGSGSVSFDQKPGATSAAGGAVTSSETFTSLSVTA